MYIYIYLYCMRFAKPAGATGGHHCQLKHKYKSCLDLHRSTILFFFVAFCSVCSKVSFLLFCMRLGWGLGCLWALLEALGSALGALFGLLRWPLGGFGGSSGCI